jgi:hypothetical protein
MIGEESEALTSPKHLSQQLHYTSDASAHSDLTHIHGHGCDLTHIYGHGCVPENDVCITMNMEELIGELAEMMGMAADSNVKIFSHTKKAIQAWRHSSTNPSHDSKSVCN